MREFWVSTGYPDEWRTRTTTVVPSVRLINLLRHRAWRTWLTLLEYEIVETLNGSILKMIGEELR